MTIDKCEPCSCTSGYISTDKFYQDMEIISCAILEQITEGIIIDIPNPLPVSQSGVWNINNITGTVSLPTGASTEITLSALNGKFGSLGQKTMAGSAPVVIASDQSAIPVSGTVTAIIPNPLPVSQSGAWTVAATQSGTWNINNISGTISLPTGAATSALQTTGNTSLSSIDGKITVCNTGAVTISGALPTGSAVIGKVSIDQTTPGTTNLVQVTSGKTLLVASGRASSNGNNTLIAADATKKITVYGISLTTPSTTLVLVKLQDGAGGTEKTRYSFQAPASTVTGSNIIVAPPAFLFQGTANTLLNLNMDSAQNIDYDIYYWLE